MVAAAAAIGIGIGFYGEELQNFVSEQQVKIAQMVKSADRKTEEEKTAQQTNAEAEAENAVTPEVQDTDGPVSYTHLKADAGSEPSYPCIVLKIRETEKPIEFLGFIIK